MSSDSSLKSSPLKPFKVRLKKSLADPNVAEGILDFQRRWLKNRSESVSLLEGETGTSFSELAAQVAEKKKKARDTRKILDQFIENAERAGSRVIQCVDAKSANHEITEILKARDVNLVVKSKSMLTEEIFLNNYLQKNDITPIETDLGEWILQIGHEHPSHLVIPAIHKRRHQIAELYEKVLGRKFDPEDITTMARVVRSELRTHFLNAGAGITGGNVLVAETGSIGIVTNEGNANLTSGLANVHIAVVGIDKLVENLTDAFEVLRLLSKSGTGQLFTTYVSFLTGPRNSGNLGNSGSSDSSTNNDQKPEQFIILVDNGRTAMAQDTDFESALGCIRCGACANVCPPYQVVGGHAFGHVYTGAIGLVNTAFHHLEKDASGPSSLCVSCGACAAVCPADIALPEQILITRQRIGKQGDSLLSKKKVRAALFIWSKPRLFRTTVNLAKRVSFLSKLLPAKYGYQKFGIRSQPSARKQIAPKSALEPPKILAETKVTGKKVVLFLQCIADQIAPDIALASARLIKATGAELVIPPKQHCCGLPALDAGDHKKAKQMAESTLNTLRDTFNGAELIVTPATSCAITMTHEYEKLTGQKLEVLDLVEFLSGPGKLPDNCLPTEKAPLAAHMFCQRSSSARRSTHITISGSQGDTDTDAPATSPTALNQLIFQLTGKMPEPLDEAEFCCGFGGFTSMVNQDVSNAILARKMENLDTTKSKIWVTDNPGCVLHIRGGANASNRKVKVLHISEYLAELLPK